VARIINFKTFITSTRIGLVVLHVLNEKPPSMTAAHVDTINSQ